MAAAKVDIVGVKALARDLKAMADKPSFQAVLSAAGFSAATATADIARSTLPSRSGALSGDVRVSRTKTGASVRMGRKKVPYAGWVEFGGRRSRPHASERVFVRNGRYLYEAARSQQSAAQDAFERYAQQALDAYDWSNTTTNADAINE
jgi:Bacteriophage HK97-gp10, putative tail-component